jgi:mannose-6-phosphate isomerase
MFEGLYPLKFEPIFKDKIWGGNRLNKNLNKKNASDKCGESWEISGIQGNISIVKNGFLAENNLQELIEIYMGELVGDIVYEKFGDEFPLLLKFIDANDNLSIQVHPNDELAKKRHKAYGKTEMWYILEAEKDSQLISGFKEEINKDIYLEAFNNNKLIDILSTYKVKEEEVYYIPSGRVHATGKGILFAEIQQTSDITYRIFDWNRVDKEGNSRELHTDLALKAIDYKKYDNYKINYQKEINKANSIIQNKYFTTNILIFNKSINRDYFALDSFVIYMCIKGKAIIDFDDKDETENISKGECILIPASLSSINLKPLEETEIIEVYIG